MHIIKISTDKKQAPLTSPCELNVPIFIKKHGVTEKNLASDLYRVTVPSNCSCRLMGTVCGTGHHSDIVVLMCEDSKDEPIVGPVVTVTVRIQKNSTVISL